MRNKELTEKLREFCEQVGIDVLGCADTDYFRRFPEENRPENFLKNSVTVIIIGFHLYDIVLDAWSKYKEKDLSFHFADSILVHQCYQIKDFLTNMGYRSIVISYKPGLFLKDTAALAGVGPIGKNNLFITKTFGSQIRLRALVTDAPLLVEPPVYESEFCIGCNSCIEACPANALSEKGYNKEACLSYCLKNLNYLSDDTVLWCNVCIESCPVGKKG